MEIENPSDSNNEDMFNYLNNLIFEPTQNEKHQTEPTPSKHQKLEGEVENLLSIDLINQINEDESINESEQKHIDIALNNFPKNEDEKETSNSDIELMLIEDDINPKTNKTTETETKPSIYSTPSNPNPPVSNNFNITPLQRLPPFYNTSLSPSNKSLPLFYNPFSSSYSNLYFNRNGWLCSNCKCLNFHIRNQCSHCGNIILRNYPNSPQNSFNGNAYNIGPLIFPSQQKMLNLSGDNIKQSHSKLSPLMSPVNNNNSKKKKPFIEREGDWICAKCKNLNFAFRVRCNRCNKIKEGEEDIKINNDKEKKGKKE